MPFITCATGSVRDASGLYDHCAFLRPTQPAAFQTEAFRIRAEVGAEH